MTKAITDRERFLTMVMKSDRAGLEMMAESIRAAITARFPKEPRKKRTKVEAPPLASSTGVGRITE